MGQVKMVMTADEAKAVAAMRRMIDAQVKVEQAGEKVKKKTKEQDDTFTKLGVNSVNQLKSMVTGMIGVGGLLAAVSKVTAEINATRNAMKALAEDAKALDQTAMAVANQMGMASTDAGQQVGEDVLASFMKAGRFGQDFGKGQAAFIATHAAYGEAGKPLSGEALETGLLAAEFAGYKQIGEEETAGMIKLIKQSKAVGKDQAARRMQQLISGYKGSLSTSESTYISGATRFMGEYSALGGSFAEGLAGYGQAIEVSGSELEAAQLMRKMGALLFKPKMTKAIAETRGISTDAVKAMSYDERRHAMREFINKHGIDEDMAKEAGLSPRQYGWTSKMYGDGGLAAIQKASAEIKGASAEGLYAELEAYAGTGYAKRQDIATGTALAVAGMSDATKHGAELMKQARKYRKLQREGAMPDQVGWGAALVHGEEWEARQVAYMEIEKRRSDATRHLRDRYGEFKDWPADVRENWNVARDETQDIMFPGLSNSREIGEAGMAVQAMERLIQAVEKNTAATEKNSGVTAPRLDVN